MTRDVFLSLLVLAAAAGAGRGAEPAKPPPYDPGRAELAERFHDPQAATQAYLESVPAERRTWTKEYSLGKYVLEIAETLYTAAVLVLLLATGLSARLRDWTGRLVRPRWLQTTLYACLFLLTVWAAQLPLTYYGSFVHEKKYGLLHQSLGGWMADQAKGLALLLIFGSLLIALLYAVLRRTPRTWWLWGWGVVMAFTVLLLAIAPVYLMPLFNKFTPLPESELRQQILAEASSRGVPARDVYKMDESKRSDRIGAFVNGLLGTTRIVLFDNLLERCSADQVLFVVGHEMGHYVLNHIWKIVAYSAIITLIGFLWVRWAFGRLAARWPRAGITGVADPAGLPLLALLFLAFSFVTMPLNNTLSRMVEAQADEFGLNVSHRPEAAATSFLMLGEYRDLDPHPLVEAIFFDHPSGRNRIRSAMKWKLAHEDERLANPKDAIEKRSR